MLAFRAQDLHTLFESAFNRRDVEAIIALYEPNAVYVTGGETVVGHDAIRDSYKSILPKSGLMKLETRTVIETSEGLALLNEPYPRS